MIYQDYLQSEHWQNLRKECFQLRGRHCAICGKTGKLHVHHIVYRKDFYDSQPEDLAPLCKKHHTKMHGDKKESYTKLLKKSYNRYKKKKKKPNRAKLSKKKHFKTYYPCLSNPRQYRPHVHY